MNMMLTPAPRSRDHWGPGHRAPGYAPIERGPIIELMEIPGLEPVEFGHLLDEVADDAYARNNHDALAEIGTAPEMEARLADSQRDLRMALWQRFWTMRHVRTRAAPDALLEIQQRTGWLRLPEAENAFVTLVTAYLVISLGFLLYTTSQMILAERIYPAVREWWQAALVTGAIQAGLLLGPLTLAKCITLSRAQLAFRVVVNIAAIGCAGLFLYWLWDHADLGATRSYMARSGLADLADLARFTLNLSHIEGKARAISILGEAFGAIAIKLNVDYLRGAHLAWKLAPNPEHIARDAEVAAKRAQVIEFKKAQTYAALLASGYERGIRINRARYRAFVESLSLDVEAGKEMWGRQLRQQALRDARWLG